jgi:hypothetical protein
MVNCVVGNAEEENVEYAEPKETFPLLFIYRELY